MIVKETGRITAIGNLQSGTSRSGKEWKKIQIVIEVTNDRGYTRQLALQAMDKPAVKFIEDDWRIGDVVTVSYEAQSREWNDVWYTDLRVLYIDAPQQRSNAQPAPAAEAAPQDDDLPL